MVAKFTRTITHTTAVVKVIDKDTYNLEEIRVPLGDYFTDKAKAVKAVQKKLYAERPNTVVVAMLDLVQESGKYEMTLDTFLKYATKVEE